MGTISAKLSKKLLKEIRKSDHISKVLSESIDEVGLNCPCCGKPWPKKTDDNEKKMPSGFYVSNENIKDLHALSAFVEAVLCKKFNICFVCHR